MQSFLDANLPSEFDSRDPEFLKQWNQALGEAGWLGFAWPKAAGGGGAARDRAAERWSWPGWKWAIGLSWCARQGDRSSFGPRRSKR